MKSEGKVIKNSHAKTGFTIIELLTAMSIIVILLSLLVPSLNTMRWYARYTTQKNQLKNVETGLHSFEMDFGEYPDSSAKDPTNADYCGAMKLAEAMAGRDGFGFHPDSRFRADGFADGVDLYPDPPPPENLRSRKEYMEARDVQLCTLNEYNSAGSNKIVLLCDVYKQNNLRNSKGDKLGMPILYYKADTSKLSHDVNDPCNADNIYNFYDNHDFVGLGASVDPFVHPLYQKMKDGSPEGPPGQRFYEMTRDESVPISGAYDPMKIRPYNKNSYILISAGRDALYGTDDDVCNFKQ